MASHPRSAAVYFLALGWFLALTVVKCLKNRTPHMVVEWVEIW